MGARSSNTNRKGDRSQSLNRLFDGHAANFFNSNLNAGTIGPNQSAGPAVEASGGNIDGLEPGNGYKYFVFTSPGTFTLSAVDDAGTDFDFLVVGGGGGGGVQHAAGGGAGGVLHGEGIPLAVGSYTVTCGGGGAGALVTPPGNGTCTYAAQADSSYLGLPGTPTVQWTGIGGGGAFSGGRSGSTGPSPLNYGSSPPTYPTLPSAGMGGPGGSGGGAGAPYHYPTGTPNPGGEGIQAPENGATGYGNDGAPNQSGDTSPTYWGGGGGAGGAGTAGPEPDVPGSQGGPGQPFPAFAGSLFPTMPAPWISATGPTGLYGGGGGRGGATGSSQSSGGPGGGGEGGAGPNPGTVGGFGVDNTGGGGGGSGGMGAAGGDGGNGIVMIRFEV